MEFKDLSRTSHQEIVELFNLAFSDYSIPVQLTLEQLKNKFVAENINQNKFVSENINREYSVIAHDGGHLVGFILHGSLEKEGHFNLYNGGTGVIPSHRGEALTVRMYEWLISQPKSRHINTIQLEVISDNVPAMKSYRKVGFDTLREIHCYKQTTILKDNPVLMDGYKIKRIAKLDWERASAFMDIQATWQNSKQAIEAQLDQNEVFGAYNNEDLIGYLIINPSQARIKQIAIEPTHRRKKIGQTLISQASKNISKALTITNIDASNTASNKFFPANGFELFLTQNEMILKLDK